MPAAETFLSNKFLAVLIFFIAKIILWSSKYIKPVVYTYFCFFAYKSHNAEAAMLAVDMLIAAAFLSSIFLAVFIFLIIKIATQRK